MTQTALVTGASSGIGYAFAEVLARHQYDLIITARRQPQLDSLKEKLMAQFGVKVTVIGLDLSQSDGAQILFDTVQHDNLTIDVLINNAGFGDYGAFVDADWNKLAQMIQLNITSLTQLSYLISKDMVARQSGQIVNVASTAAFFPGPLMAVYFATKAFVLSFSEALAKELEKTGVSVTALCPGVTASEFQQVAAMEEAKSVKGQSMPSSMDVAEYGFQVMQAKKVVAVHGTANQILAHGARRLLPRFVVRNLVHSKQKKA